jgi:hypothetical protein
VLRERHVEVRVAEHRRDVDREVTKQPRHAGGIVEDTLRQRRDRGQLLLANPPPHAPPQRGGCVLAEVVPVVPVNALEEQLQLDPLEIELRFRPRRCSLYWYSHTRISERSWSVSTGFVM